MSASTHRSAVREARELRARLEAQRLDATAAFERTEGAVASIRRGTGSTDGTGATTGLVDAFEPLERGAFEAAVESLSTLSDAYRPSAMESARGKALTAYEKRPMRRRHGRRRGRVPSERRQDDRQFRQAFGRMVDLFGERLSAQAETRLELLVRLYRTTTDDPRFEQTLKEIDEAYTAVFTDALDEPLARVRDLFGDEATGAEPAIERFETAYHADDSVDAAEALADLTATFESVVRSVLDAWRAEFVTAIDETDTVAVEAGFDRLRDRLRGANSRLEDAERRLTEALERYVELLPTDPDAVLSELSEADPVVLFPVQLETRFERDASGDVSALQIRVYPDDIHVESHERTLTDAERVLGVRFWAHCWWACHETDGESVAQFVPESGVVADAFAEFDLGVLPNAAASRYDAVKERAWSNLVDRLGTERAGWVKTATAPPAGVTSVLLDGPVPPAEVPAVDFEMLGEDVVSSPGSWTQVPRARLLPDRWVVSVTTETERRTVVGATIPEPLPLGPDPDPVGAAVGDTETDPATDTGGLHDDDGAKWLVDFERARAVGMGVELPIIAADVPSEGLDVVVVGVKTSIDDAESAEALRDLFEDHHYTDGLSMLASGTPTNATADGSPPFATSDDATAALPVECGRSLLETESTTTALDGAVVPDGARLARLLAIDADRLSGDTEAHVFAHVDGAGGTADADALHMNTALWSATWGTYVPNMLFPRGWVGNDFGDYDTALDWLGGFREHFLEYVRADGPFPTLRVGRQPYGVLPTTALGAWSDAPMTPTPEPFPGPEGGYDSRQTRYPVVTDTLRDILFEDGQFDAGLLPFWEASVGGVPHVEDGTTGSLLELLSMSATAYGYRGHNLFSVRGLWHSLTGTPTPPPDQFATAIGNLLSSLESGVAVELMTAFGVDVTKVPRIVSLLYGPPNPRHYGATTGPLEPLVGPEMDAWFSRLQNGAVSILSGLPSDESPLEGLDFELKHSFSEDLTRLYGSLFYQSSPSLLGKLLTYATLQEYALARVRLESRFRRETTDELGRDTMAPLWRLLPEPDVYTDTEESLLDRLDDEVPPLLARHPELRVDDEEAKERDVDYHEALEVAKAVTDPALEVDATFREFMTALAYFEGRGADQSTLTHLFTGTLDLATHRVDAWATSLATRRLDEIRTAQEQTGENPGVHIGGYGTVTGLRPDEKDSLGYLHAPSLSQATTGAVLRSGSLSTDGERRSMLDLDLSAERVRKATTLFDGLRTGQSLGALLGYRFERALHERGLDVYVPEFRRLEPGVAGKLDRSGDEPDTERTADTVDGVALVRRAEGSGQWADISASDRIPWGEAVDSTVSESTPLPPRPGPTTDEGDADPDYLGLSQALDELVDIVDSVRDVLVAESVHGLVTGRPMQGGASLDALARGEAPPQVTFTQTPRSGVGITHRLLVLFDDPSTLSDGDNPTTPWPETARAAAEPTLNAWFATLLPDPDTTVCLCEVDRNDGTPPTPLVITLGELAVAPMDLLVTDEAVTTTQRSALEERIRHRVSRARGLSGDHELRLRFDRPTAWIETYSAASFERADPAQTVPDLTAATDLGSVLELVRVGHELVAGGRAADATDLTLPTAETEHGGVDAAALRARADTATAQLSTVTTDLDEPLEFLRPRRPDEEPGDGRATPEAEQTPVPTEPSTVERLDVVADALGAVSTRLGTLADSNAPTAATVYGSVSEVATALAGVDEGHLYDAIDELAGALAGPLAVFATVGDRVELEAVAGQTVSGATVATEGTTLRIRLGGTDTELLRTETATVAVDGTFQATFDLSAVPVGTAVDVSIETATETLTAADGVVVDAITGTLSTPALSPPKTEPLEAYRRPMATLVAVESELATLASALEAVDTTALRSTLDAQPWADLATRPGWQNDWSTDTPVRVETTLELVDARLPGFGTPETTSDPWNSLVALVDVLPAEVNLVELSANERAEMAAHLSDAVDGDDRATWTAAVSTLDAALEADAASLATGIDEGPASIVAAGFALVEAVRGALVDAAAFLEDGLPVSANGAATGGERKALVRQAVSVAQTLTSRSEAATDAASDVTPDTQLARLTTIFGESFPVLPPFETANTAELDLALTESHHQVLRGDDPLAAETWVDRVGRVRDAPATLGTLLTYGDAVGTTGGVGASRYRLGQLPYEPTATWIGLESATERHLGGRLSLVVHPALGTDGDPYAGLFVDEWVEVIPEPQETTGVAFNYDSPGNRPPQSVLVAVPPNDAGWSIGTLEETVVETMSLAHSRMVDSDALGELGHFLPALTYAQPDDAPGSPERVAVSFDDLIVPEAGADEGGE
ncbi:BGTF surface domain-containing protein [Salinigranum marinum]|uniref:BGTF surface domain-containing protein n=1 Tax=Salinigranum marinum TaxID=1515595 RepID=UPI002989B2D4|nr:BGTF surface domain-containing protein [Salinigranum marinum]